MPDHITVYLAPGETVYWCEYGGARVKQGQFADALEDINARDVVIVLAGETALLTQVELPPIRQATRRLQAARYALEEQVAAPVDKLHFALAPRQPDGVTPVAVIDDEYFSGCLASFGNARSQITAVVQDFFCLPAPAADNCNLRMLDGRAIVRMGQYSGFACELDLLDTLLRGAGTSESTLNIAAQNDPAVQACIDQLAQSGHVVAPRTEKNEYQWLASVTPHTGINLLQGVYTPRSAMNDAWRPLQATAALAGVWLVIALAIQGFNYFQLSNRTAELNQQAEATFRKAFPRVQNINDIRVQAEQNLRALKGSGGASGIFPLLGATAVATNAASGLQVQSLQYRDGALTLSLRGENIQALEGLRSSFAKQPGALLEVESADAASEGVQIRARVTGAGA